jgi:hypothetical protein
MELTCVGETPSPMGYKDPTWLQQKTTFYPFVLLSFCYCFHYAMIVEEFNVASPSYCLANGYKILGKMRDMKHIKNFDNVTCMEVNGNCSHVNCFLVPIILHENRKGRIQRFVFGKPIFSWCQMFNCTCIQILSLCTIVFFYKNCHKKLKYFNWRCWG